MSILDELLEQAWGAVEKELISLRPDPTESSWTDDFEQNKILTALAELDPQQVKKSLQALGAGILGQRSEKSSSLEEKLLFSFGGLIASAVERYRRSRTMQRKQNDRIEQAKVARRRKKLQDLSAEEFEYWTAGYFQRHGFKNEAVTTFSSDFGVDVFVDCPDGQKAVVQCKRYKGNVGRPVVQQTYGVMKLLKAQRCYVATTGGFTEPALELGKRKDIILLDGNQLSANRRPAGGGRTLHAGK